MKVVELSACSTVTAHLLIVMEEYLTIKDSVRPFLKYPL